MNRNNNINWDSIWAKLPEITGLPFKFHRGKYYANCYANGTKHKRRDKTVATFKKGKIRIIEQGGFSDDLVEWMLLYGNYSSYKDVYRALGNESKGYIVPPKHIEPPRIYVYYKYMNISLHKYNDTLYRFFCTLFDAKQVRAAYDLYNIGSFNDDTIFWYVDRQKRICHDKRLKYKSDGHRDKETFPYKFFKQDKGFAGKCYFGDHLLNDTKDDIYLVESEKTAILFYLYYGKICLASGGSNCLMYRTDHLIRLPDYDLAGCDWIESNSMLWWNYYPDIEINVGDDIGDVIIKLKKVKLNKKNHG